MAMSFENVRGAMK